MDTAGISERSYYAQEDCLNPPYFKRLSGALDHVWCRRSVAEKLHQANTILTDHGVELLALDGYRPIECQRALWEHFLHIAREQYPHETSDAHIDFARRYCFDPGVFDEHDAATWPTHITGGAVDVTLQALGGGEILYMGGVFDDPSDIAHTRYYERVISDPGAGSEEVPLSHLEAAKNRRLLYWAMTKCDFANYPLEWWHFDWGNRMWVENTPMISLEPPAWYSPAIPP